MKKNQLNLKRLNWQIGQALEKTSVCSIPWQFNVIANWTKTATTAIILLSILFMSNRASAQWNTMGGNIYYSGGNVGIGTSNPTEMLSVLGVVRSVEYHLFSTDNYLYEIGPAENALTGISIRPRTNPQSDQNIFTVASSGSATRFGVTQANGGWLRDGLIIGADYASTSLPSLGGNLIVNGGSLGVGNMNPSEAIDVVGNVKATSFIGDGSQLTGLTAFQFDLTGNDITSGTIGGTTKISTSGNIVTTGNIAGSVVSGSFIGDGSQLTGISSSQINFSGSDITSGTIGGTTAINTSGIITTTSEYRLTSADNQTYEIGPSQNAPSGVAVKPQVNPANDQNIFLVESSGTSSRFGVTQGNGAWFRDGIMINKDNEYDNTSLPGLAGNLIVNGGKVGIGNTNPAEALDVVGNVKATTFIGDGSQLTGVTISQSNITGDDITSGTIGGTTAINTSGSITTSGDINANGNMMAGEYRLNSSFDTRTYKIAPANNGIEGIAVRPEIDAISSDNIFMVASSGSATRFGVTQEHGGWFKDGLIIGTDYANTPLPASLGGNLIMDGGRIGIGTVAPSQALDVVGNVKATELIGTRATIGDLPAGIPANGDPDVALTVSGRMMVTNGSADSQLGAFYNGVYPADLPNYTMWIEDAIVSEGFWVVHPCIWDGDNTNCPTDWGDYVFEKDYHLRPLSEVKAFVGEHKHLPGIPAAEEVMKGYEMHDMNKNMIVKIEELTLYTIEQQEKLERQDLEIQELSKQIEKLKGLIKSKL